MEISKSSPGSLIIISVAVIGIGIWMSVADNRVDIAPAKPLITIPEGTGHAIVPARPIPAVVPSGPEASETGTAKAILNRIAQAYPMLSDVDLRCEPDRCVLLGTPTSPANMDEQVAREEMLLGGLSSFLATQGYTPLGPIEMDETGDEEYRIRLPLARDPRTLAAADRASD